MVRWVHKIAKNTISKAKSAKDINQAIGKFGITAISHVSVTHIDCQPLLSWSGNYKFLKNNIQTESWCNSQALITNGYYTMSSGSANQNYRVGLPTPTVLSVAVAGAPIMGAALTTGASGAAAASVSNPILIGGVAATVGRNAIFMIKDSQDMFKTNLKDLKIDISKFMSKSLTVFDDVKKLIKTKNDKAALVSQDADINEFPIVDINTFSSLLAEESYTMPSGLTREQKLEWLSENQKKILNMK